MAKKIMIQGTMSSVGKSLLTAGLCRLFVQDGYKVAPFKSQNMALNSFITEDGLEIGRAQAMQAEAAKTKPSAYMNPILLKPTSDIGSQVIVNGKSIGNMRAKEYFAYKQNLVDDIDAAISKLEEEFDIIVIEGAGSPVEMNLKHNDIVNMGLAMHVKSPVLLVGDIDRGGVFAQLVGTMELLEEDEKNLVKGLIINKFRGDVSLFSSGIEILKDKTKKDVLGVVNYLPYQFEEEDSISERFTKQVKEEAIDIAVIHYPRISNYTDLHPFEEIAGVSLRFVSTVEELKNPDMIILPGSKNTMEDLLFIRQNGLEAAILKQSNSGTLIFGICGGYQMLGETIKDPYNMEAGGKIRGMELLPLATEFGKEKHTVQVSGTICPVDGLLSGLSEEIFKGYEIHMGLTVPTKEVGMFCENGTGYYKENVFGTYVHGFFDKKAIVNGILHAIAKKKGVELQSGMLVDYNEKKEKQYDALANALRASLDMEKLYKILEQGV